MNNRKSFLLLPMLAMGGAYFVTATAQKVVGHEPLTQV